MTRHEWVQYALMVFVCAQTVVAADDAVGVRREALLRSYGTYDGDLRKADGHLDVERLIRELREIGANSYNYLIAHADSDWDDLHAFLPAAKKSGVWVWVTVLPPSESPPRTKRYSEPFRLEYEKWAAELAGLSKREPALVAWSIDDFAHNLKVYTPERMRKIIAAQREANPRFAFVPCVYYRQATAAFVRDYRGFLDGILFPYRSESTTPGLKDPAQIEKEVSTLKERFGRDFPIIVDIYATAHSRLGASTPEYVEAVMQGAFPVADGVHIYRHQNKQNASERVKYDLIERVMSSWRVRDRDKAARSR